MLIIVSTVRLISMSIISIISNNRHTEKIIMMIDSPVVSNANNHADRGWGLLKRD